jgi:Ca-activated chloride channel family protein
MRPCINAILALLSTLLAATALPLAARQASAQSSSAQAPSPTVLIPVTVETATNTQITGLQQTDFLVFEDDRQQQIGAFSGEDTPASIGVILDLSGSTNSKLDAARKSILQFIRKANPEDEYFVVGFSDRSEQIEGFTNSLEKIQARLAAVQTGHPIPLLDSIHYGMAKMKEARHERKALLVISNSGDNPSRYTASEVRAQVRESDVEIYAIDIVDPHARTPQDPANPRLLGDVTEETGGRLVQVSDLSQMSDTTEGFSTELRSQYLIGYRPKNPNRDGKWREVKVKVIPPAGLPPLTVHARTGYFAPAQTLAEAVPAKQPAAQEPPATPSVASSAPAPNEPAAPQAQPPSQPPPTPEPSPASQPPPTPQTPLPSASSLAVDHDPVRSPDGESPTPTIQRKQGEGYVLRTDVEEVLLNCTVLEGSRLVQDLKKEDFQVAEDGVKQTLISFQHTDLPVSIALVVDNSGSMSNKRPSVNKSALDLILASNPDDEAFVVNFSDEAFIDQDFTSDIKKLREGLGHIESRGGTALYDAVAASADKLAADAKRPKQVLVIITDGEDNSSTLDLEQTIRRIQQLSGPVIYSIGLLFGDEMSHAEASHARRALKMLSDETGGMAFFPKSIDQIDQIAAEVARDIRNQYTLGYHSTKPTTEPGYRRVQVTAEAKGLSKLTVRTRTGYFPVARGAKKTAATGNQ